MKQRFFNVCLRPLATQTDTQEPVYAHTDGGGRRSGDTLAALRLN